MSGRGRTLLGLLVLIVGVVQVGVPVASLLEPRPSRFGWQMYSGLTRAPVVSVEDETGDLRLVDAGPLIGEGRAEIRWAQPLARTLCDDGVAAVIVTDREGTTRVPCP
jgi:hypothetical protein